MNNPLFGLFVAACVFVNPVMADDRVHITQSIHRLTTGVDNQDGELLRRAFHDDAAIFATTPAGDALVTLTAESFAGVHADKRFGGQQRSVHIESLDVTDGLIAHAKVIAENDAVHYTYYLGFTKLDGTWRIQSFLQRSKPAAGR